jgi:hypothetical protein
MLLAVKANRVTFTSSASSGSAAASGSCVSMILLCCRSLRATMNSVACMASIPCGSHAAIFAPADDRFATAMMLKTVFGSCAEISPRHCEERSDEAIHLSPCGEMDCFASLAMTWRGVVPNFRHARA